MRRGSEHGLHGLHGFFLGTWIFLWVPWCVGFLNTDFTDYTDNFSEDADIPLGSVVRRVLEHGFHGLHR